MGIAGEHPVPVRKLTYGDVLTDRQKELLRERAEFFGVAVGDYEKVLDNEEKTRLDALLHERMKRLVSE